MFKKNFSFIVAFLFSCNFSSNKKDNYDYYDGKVLYEKKCSSCHSFLTMEGLNQTSLDQMRQLSLGELYTKVLTIQTDTNHTKLPLNIDKLGISDIKNIVFYIKETGSPKN